jgi:hypothetical protein
MSVLRSILLGVCIASTAPAQFQPPPDPDAPAENVPANPGGALAALALVPPKYGDGILKLSADNGTPNPPTWYILAKKTDGEVYSLSVAKGQIIQEKPSLNLRALLGNPTPINLSKVKVDSTGAWNVAMGYCTQKGRTLGSVSYVLQQKGADAVPVWGVWCYGPDGGYIGYVELLATTGAIVSSE